MKADFGMYHIYQWWRKKLSARDRSKIYNFNTSCQSYNDITRGVFGDVWDTFIDKVTDKIIMEGYSFRMPARMGTLYIGKFKPNKLNKDGSLKKNNTKIDMHETLKMWKRYPEHYRKKWVYFTNEHTFGYVMCWYWNKALCTAKNKTSYSFNPTLGMRRKLSKVLKGNEIYTDYKNISYSK